MDLVVVAGVVQKPIGFSQLEGHRALEGIIHAGSELFVAGPFSDGGSIEGDFAPLGVSAHEATSA